MASDRHPGVPTPLVGTLTVHPRGFGFVAPLGGEGEDVFIPPGRLAEALSGDQVEVVITEPDAPRGPVGRVQRVVTPRPAEFMAELCERDGAACVRPLLRDLPPVLPLADAGRPAAGPAAGQWVRARLVRPGRPDEPLRAAIVRTAGAVGPLERTLDAVAAEFDLMPPYSEEEQAAAARLQPEALPRESLLDRIVVAIDPADAKDHDDALSVEPGPTPDTVRVGIHIADVAAYITPGSRFDQAAARRGFTAYLPGRTLPMLPKVLAGTLCSLVEGEERPAHTVFIDVARADGRILHARRCHSRVRVRALLTYDAVQQFLESGEAPGWNAEVRHAVRELAGVAARLREQRAGTEEFLDLATEEVRVRCAENPPRVVDIVREPANEAHALVEEFMLAANTAVAVELHRRRIPGLYRVHDEPCRAELEEFRAWAGRTFGLKVRSLHTRTGVNRFLNGLAHDRLRPLLLGEFLRALPRAGYASDPSLHYGLGKEFYCHFTSPIRRYADLAVHQQLLAVDRGEAPRPAAWCRQAGEELSRAEERIDNAYFAANDRMKLHYLLARQAQDPAAPVLPGVVARDLPGGWSIYLPEFGMFGVLAAAGTRETRTRQGRGADPRGRAGMPHRRVGDSLSVSVQRIDLVRGELFLRPAAVAAPSPGTRRRGDPGATTSRRRR